MNNRHRIVDDPYSKSERPVRRPARDLWQTWGRLTRPERRGILNATALIPAMAIGARLLSYEHLLGPIEH